MADMFSEIIKKEQCNLLRLNEVNQKAVTHGDVAMRYSQCIIGEKPKDGYPLFIALHGGGQCDTPELNDSQWDIMKEYYKKSVENGIYIATRGIRDTWDTHFNPESYYMYKRIIQNMIIFCGANPNKVYLMGYSAGGDGVYQITPRMADYFGAVNMSAGHPNNVELENAGNVAFYIQCGENDCAYDRNKINMEYAGNANVKKAFIHKGKGHQIIDNGEKMQEMITGEICDTNAVRLISKHEREPYPKNIVWNLRYKTENMFYYVTSTAKKGLIEVKRSGNIFVVDGDADSLLINERFVDFNKDVTVIYNGEEKIFEPKASEEVKVKTFSARFDRDMTFSCELKLKG